MHRLTIVQNKIVSIICSSPFFCPSNIYRLSLRKVQLCRPNPKLLQPLNFYLRRKRKTPFYSELYALQRTVARFWILIFIYFLKNIKKFIYPLWLHRQGGCLAYWRLQHCTFESWLWRSCTDLLFMRHSGGTAREGGGCNQSIGSTVSDAIVRSWLWSTATRSSLLGCFITLLQVVDNWPHILW